MVGDGVERQHATPLLPVLGTATPVGSATIEGRISCS